MLPGLHGSPVHLLADNLRLAQKHCCGHVTHACGCAGDSLEAVAEVVYIPIYVKSAPDAGVQAVVEVVVSSCAREAMVVANLISFVSNTLHDLRVRLPCCYAWTA